MAGTNQICHRLTREGATISCPVTVEGTNRTSREDLAPPAPFLPSVQKVSASASSSLRLKLRCPPSEPVWPSGKALIRLVSGRTSVRYRFGSPFSSKRLWFVDTVL